MSKVKLATVWLDGCSGCHMSFLDMDERLIELAELVDMVYSPIVDTKEFPDEVDIALVEGAVASVDDEKKIKKIREHSKMLVAMGDCAVAGNVPVDAQSHRAGSHPQPRLHRERDRAAADSLHRGAPAAQEGAPHSRVCDGGRVSSRVPALGRHLPRRADRAANRRTAGDSGAHPLWSLTPELTMSQTITIDPVTRLEGHGKITIQLNGQGEVEDAHFHVTQVRGFEKFSEGRPFYEMPSLMARICGICPVSHLIASAKACEAIMSVRIPHTAAQLRRMLNLAQMVQSHALSFFYLSSPDLLLGMESDPKVRHIFGVVAAKPELGRAGIALRRFGQHIIELLGNKRIHPGWVVPGGVTEPLAAAKRDEILAMMPEAFHSIKLALAAYKQIADSFRPEIEVFANFPTNYHEPDQRRRVDRIHRRRAAADRRRRAMSSKTASPRKRFTEVIGEAVEPYSYTKFAYYKPLGYPKGSYRVGPLARLNIATTMGTPLADIELAEFKQLARGPVQSSFYYHHARLIEILYGIEKIEQILTDPHILDKHVRAVAGVNRLEGAGQAEAPRGHAAPSLQGGRERPHHLGQPRDRHWPEQQRHEQGRCPGREVITSRTASSLKAFSTASKPWSAHSTRA